MCEYCEHVEFETKVGDPTPRKWFKRFSADTYGSGSWHLFYRHGDDHPWYISHNGTIAPINFCPNCGKDLRERRIFKVHTDKMDKTEAESFMQNAIKAYSKKIDDERFRDERATINA
jgi:hypothetical protein